MVAHQFTVTRQRQWPDGTLCVEISQGGSDYTNPGQLVAKFPKLGEGETFDGMTPAVNAGIAVYKAWKEAEPDAEIGIAVGYTGGNTLPFDGRELDEEDLRQRAAEFDEKLECCVHCGEILGKTKYSSNDGHEYDCCSEHCAQEEWAANERLNAEESEPEEDE